MKRKRSIRDSATETMQLGIIGALGVFILLFGLLGNMPLKTGGVRPIRAAEPTVLWTWTEPQEPPEPPQEKVAEVKVAEANETPDTILPAPTSGPFFPGQDRIRRTLANTPPPPPDAVLPRPRDGLRIEYPQKARLVGLEGRVIVLAGLDKKGNVFDVRIQKSSGYALLDSAAVRGVRNTRFTPAMQHNEPLAVKILVPVNFKLNGG